MIGDEHGAAEPGSRAGHAHLPQRQVEPERRTDMVRSLGAGVALALVALLPAEPAAAQNSIGGAIIGGTIGGIIGGAAGRNAGAAFAGAAIGAATGAIIASEAQRNAGGYYWWHGGCYYQYPNGAWVQIAPNYCY
jgi:hypothetical protein